MKRFLGFDARLMGLAAQLLSFFPGMRGEIDRLGTKVGSCHLEHEATFQRTAISFDNPDFVDVVIHCYRFGFGTAEGDPALAPLERRLDERPPISVPTVTLDGTQDPLKPGGTADHAPLFSGRHETPCRRMWAQHASGGTGRFLVSHFDYPRVDLRHLKFKLTHYGLPV